MANPETVIQQEIRLHSQKAYPGLRLFRNECGTAVIKEPGEKPRHVRYGLSPSSPDLVGWRSLVITPDMVGQTIAQFVGIEVKTEEGARKNGPHERRQKKWIDLINQSGGLAFIATSPDEANQKLSPDQED